MKIIRVVLFVVILIGLGLLATQSYWMPAVVDTILKWQGTEVVTPLPTEIMPVIATTTTNTMADWNWVYATTSAAGTQFMYPNPLPTTYVSAVEWPPQVILSAGTVSCAEGDMASHGGDVTKSMLRKISNRDYCVSVSSEGAAGSTYTQYQYATAQGDFVASVSFTLRTPQCMNYDEPNQSACKNEQATFNVDALAERILESITMR